MALTPLMRAGGSPSLGKWHSGSLPGYLSPIARQILTRSILSQVCHPERSEGSRPGVHYERIRGSFAALRMTDLGELSRIHAVEGDFRSESVRTQRWSPVSTPATSVGAETDAHPLHESGLGLHQPITDPRFGLKVARRMGIGLKLLAQVGHVYPAGNRCAPRRRAPRFRGESAGGSQPCRDAGRAA